MKKELRFSTAITLLGLVAAVSHGEIKLTDNLSTSGFVDMSLNGAKDSTDADATLAAGLDQFEIDFMYKYGNVSARADINALPSAVGGNTNVTIEQAFITGTLGAVSITSGRFLSASGFEAAEPTGMYQYSYSRQLSTNTPIYGGYQNGVNVAWTSPMFGLYAAVVSDLYNAQEFDIMNTAGYEAQVSVTPMEGVTAKAAYLFQMHDETDSTDNHSLINVWASYAKGAITVAAEYDMTINGGGVKELNGNSWLAMANYKFTDKVAATVRYSGNKFSAGDVDLDTQSEFTISPSFAFTPNWLILAEYKMEIDAEKSNYALETTFSF